MTQNGCRKTQDSNAGLGASKTWVSVSALFSNLDSIVITIRQVLCGYPTGNSGVFQVEGYLSNDICLNIFRFV